MLLPRDWDKSDPHSVAPPFTPEDVERMLGAKGKRELEHRKSDRSQVLHRYMIITFDCGCVAYESRGWAPCDRSLHALLASHLGDQGSDVIDRFKEMKVRFDHVVRESWSRYRPDDKDVPGARPADRSSFRESHDINGLPVWQSDSLKADLDFVPGESTLILYNAGTIQAPYLVLELESRVAPRPDYNELGVLDAMAIPEERLLELAFRRATEVTDIEN